MLLLGFLLLALVVVVAAALNIVSGAVGLGLLPEFYGSQWPFIIKNYLADAVLWILVAVIMACTLRMLRDRGNRVSLTSSAGGARRSVQDARIAVALIAYNEEMSISDVVADFGPQPAVETVIVVDNNSCDETAARAAAAGARVVREPNRGYGFACMRALREGLRTGTDIVVLCEGDGTYSAHDVGKLVPFLQDTDMVLGNRITPGLVHRSSQMDTFFVWGNQLGAKLLQLRFWEWRFLGRLRLSDLGCTFRAIRREALAEIADELSVGGDHFSPHMIMVALSRGLSIVEVPVTFWPRVGVSKGASGNLRKATAVALAMLWHILTFPAGRRPASLGPQPTTADESICVEREASREGVRHEDKVATGIRP